MKNTHQLKALAMMAAFMAIAEAEEAPQKVFEVPALRAVKAEDLQVTQMRADRARRKAEQWARQKKGRR